MSKKEEYERRKAAQEAKRKDSLSKRWQLGNTDRLFQALLVLFTFGLVAVGALQWGTLDKTEETLKAAQRPWVEFDAKIIGPLGYTGDEMTMLVQLGLKNSGHSPALNVRVDGKMRLIWESRELLQIQYKICDSLRVVGKESFGSTIFPNNPRQSWSRFAGQNGGLAKVDSGFDYAANFSSYAWVA